MKKHKKQKKHINFIKYFFTLKRMFFLLLTGFILYFFLTNPIQKIKTVNAALCTCTYCPSNGTTVYFLPVTVVHYVAGCSVVDCGGDVISYTLPFVDYNSVTITTLPSATATTVTCCLPGKC
ncbi:MAG: hypothetical protein WC744_02550 [Patescibacteria group bacterium]|jgi:hypothetical protein